MSNDTTGTEATTVEIVTEAASVAVEGTATGEGAPGEGTVSQAEYDALKAELATFKRDVAEITGRYAVRHGMCATVDTALNELGLRRPVSAHRVTVTLDFTFDIASQSGRKSSAPTDKVMWSHVRTLTDSLRYDDLDAVVRSLGSINGAMPGLTVRTASVSSEYVGDDGNGHLIGAPIVICYECGERSADQVCPSCGHDNRTR